MNGYEVAWHSFMSVQMRIGYYCEGCGVPAGSPSGQPQHVRGPITLPADAVCAACGKTEKPEVIRLERENHEMRALLVDLAEEASASIERVNAYLAHRPEEPAQ